MIGITNLEAFIATEYFIIPKGTFCGTGEGFAPTEKWRVPILKKEFDTEDEALAATVLWLREKYKEE